MFTAIRRCGSVVSRACWNSQQLLCYAFACAVFSFVKRHKKTERHSQLTVRKTNKQTNKQLDAQKHIRVEAFSI